MDKLNTFHLILTPQILDEDMILIVKEGNVCFLRDVRETDQGQTLITWPE